jgi:hypothetical protein
MTSDTLDWVLIIVSGVGVNEQMSFARGPVTS